VSLYRDLDLDDVADEETAGFQGHVPVESKVFAVKGALDFIVPYVLLLS